ncbi:MAG: pentapeptide repeat-containing protein [Chitinophagales bacterium]|nr:pentapeptide repeat-containing protein [Chitinophagales bacterium]
MKAARNLFIGLILGAVIGWVLGFLRFPYLEKNQSFLLGFIACIVFILLLLILLFIWNKNAYLVKLIGKNSAAQNSNNAARTYLVIWILVAAFIIIGGLISSFLIFKQNELFEANTQYQNQRIKEQTELIESSRRSSMVILLSSVMDKVDEELKNNPTRTLSDNKIASIVEAFNYSFQPHRYLEGDSLSAKKLSPEKGQLLLALYARKIDSVSFNKIKHSAAFNGADLRGANLSGIDLSGTNLTGADLRDANLNGAIFKTSNLRGTNMRGAKLNKTNLNGADLRRADLSWAELNESELESANLSGADLTNAQLRNANLQKANFRAAKLDEALLNGANLEGGNLVDASLVKANLTRANLTKADFNRTNFSEAIMAGAELANANVVMEWFEKLRGWKIIEAKEIQKHYKIVIYEVVQDVTRYRLEKVK